MSDTRKTGQVALSPSRLSSPRPQRTFLLPLAQKRRRGASSCTPLPHEGPTPTNSNSYISRKARRVSISSPYSQPNIFNFPSPMHSSTLTPPKSIESSPSASHRTLVCDDSPASQRRRERRAKSMRLTRFVGRINIPKAPDFLKLVNESRDKTILPTSSVPHLAIKRAPCGDENPFLVASPSSTYPTHIAQKLWWSPKLLYHISEGYLDSLFVANGQEIPLISATIADAGDNNHASYLDTMYIVDDAPLGTGKYSKVFRIRDRKSNELHAVKILKKSVQGAMERKRYLFEARNMWKTERPHPNVVQLLGVWEQDGKIYMKMELCEFGSLDKMLKRQKPHGGLDEGCMWHCLKDISAGVQAIHNSNIVHLDLKPENICISSTGSLKIGDFGHSAILPVHETDGIEGDKRYMAPELLNGQCGKYSDIFSLGISMYEIQSNRCGEIPGEGPEWHQLRNGIFVVARGKTITVGLDEEGIVSDPGYLVSTSEVHSSLCQLTNSELLDLIKAMMQTTHENRPPIEEVFLMALERTSIMFPEPLGSRGGRGALYEIVYGPEIPHSIRN